MAARPDSVDSGKPCDLLLVGLVAIAALATVVVHVEQAWNGTFAHPFDWISTNNATMGRAFATSGIFSLGWVPIANNPPLGLAPDAYLHWPPLWPVTLAVCFELFGASAAVAQLINLLVVAAIAALVFAMGRTVAGRTGGLLACLFYLVTPTLVQFGVIVHQLHPALFCALLAALFYSRLFAAAAAPRWLPFAGAGALFVGVLFAWEACLVSAGVLVAGIASRNRGAHRLALLYLAAALAALGLVFAVYLIQYPQLFDDLWNIALHRGGLASYHAKTVTIHTMWNEQYYADRTYPLALVLHALISGLESQTGLIGVAALVAVLAFLVRQRREPGQRQALVLLTVIAPPLFLWALLMPQHLINHINQFELLAPAAALALAVLGSALLQRFEREPTAPYAWESRLAVVVVALFMLEPLVDSASTAAGKLASGQRVMTDEHRFGLELRAATPAGAVVTMPYASMAPFWPAERHLIRGVYDDATLERVLPGLRENFAGAPCFVAFTRDRAPDFGRALARFPLVWQNANTVVLRIEAW